MNFAVHIGKSFLLIIAVFLITGIDCVMAQGEPSSADFYVAPNGNDDWSGTLAEPNTGRTDGPFATLDRARDAVRDLKKTQFRDIVVLIREGVYYLNRTVVFGTEDSGEGEYTITYAAYPGENPVISSAMPIRGWRKLDEYPSELPVAAQGHVWVADLPKTSAKHWRLYVQYPSSPSRVTRRNVLGSGILTTLNRAVRFFALYNTVHQAGASARLQTFSAGASESSSRKWRFFTLYDDEGKLPRARSSGFAPNDSLASSKEILDFPAGALKDWENLEDVEIVIRPKQKWVLNILPLLSVDEDAHLAHTTILGSYPLTSINNYDETCWVENVLEALDQPGEWVLNTREGKLYLWPRNPISEQQIMAPFLRELIRVEGEIDFDGPVDIPVRNLCFKGLKFMHGDRDLWTRDEAGLTSDWEMYDKNNALVRLRGAENCIIESCHFTHSGGTAIRVDLYGQQNRIINNHIEHMGGTGILLCGYGPGTKDVSKQNEVLNNYIHHCGEIYWQSLGIFIWQTGENRIANNLIHDMPYTGININGGGQPKYFETPEKRDVSRTIRWHEVGPPGPRTYEEIEPFIHTRNNIVEKNEIHHVMEKMGDGNGIYIRKSGAGNIIRRNYLHHLVGPTSNQAVIRTDGQQRDTLVTENVIYKCVATGIVLKCNNHIENNIIMNILKTNDPENIHQIAPREYIRLREGPLTGAALKRNILYYHGGSIVFYNESESRPGYEPALAKDADTDYNIYYTAGNPSVAQAHLDTMQADGVDLHSLAVDPLVIDPENGNFQLAPESPALGLGFIQIDISEIGLQSK